MAEMTSQERFARMFAHREADRVPIFDQPWPATIERWRAEGLPADADYAEYFGLDRLAALETDNSPRLPVRVVEETAEYIISTTRWGLTVKNWKHAASTPQLLDATITDRESWEKAKARMKPARDRVDWARLAVEYPRWRAQGAWVEAVLIFGFDITHARVTGTERLLFAMVEDPDWCREMFAHQLETGLALLEMTWDAGYRFDGIYWPDDMGYKGKQFFSPAMYRSILKPYHRRAVEWAHERGIRAHLHSCGDINPFLPDLVEIGLDALNPMEVKAGMDPLAIKKAWGGKLVLHGGINAALWSKPNRFIAEMERVVPALKAGGGYILASDHSVPSSVSLADFRRFVARAKELGAY
jgi:uroporphyrinogen decarboxylase